MEPISLLNSDHCSVRLVDTMGTDLTVVNAARVSFAKESDWDIDTDAKERLDRSGSRYHDDDLNKLKERDVKLINYLATHEHWTPFAHPQITLSIAAPISIRTQFFKHKQGFVENEVSRRYVKDRPVWYHPRWRTAPDGSMKQGSGDFLEYDKEADAMCIDGAFHFAVSECVRVYDTLISQGVAPEQARMVLPQGTITEWYWTGSLAAYARFYKQRSAPHAQWEIREYASLISTIIAPLFPVSWSALTRSCVEEMTV